MDTVIKTILDMLSQHATCIITVRITPAAAAAQPVRQLPPDADAAAQYEPRATATSRSAVSRQYSRYNFERNAIRLAYKSTHVDTEGWQKANELATTYAGLMQLTYDTARSHVLRAVKMGILETKKVGNTQLVRMGERNKPVTITFAAQPAEADNPTAAQATQIEAAEALLP